MALVYELRGPRGPERSHSFEMTEFSLIANPCNHQNHVEGHLIHFKDFQPISRGLYEGSRLIGSRYDSAAPGCDERICLCRKVVLDSGSASGRIQSAERDFPALRRLESNATHLQTRCADAGK